MPRLRGVREVFVRSFMGRLFTSNSIFVMPDYSEIAKGRLNRAVGTWLLGCGALLCYVGIIDPIYSAAHQIQVVSLFIKASVVAPLFLSAGLVFAIVGDKATAYLGTREKPSITGWIFYLFFIVVGLVAYYWVQKTVESYGYVLSPDALAAAWQKEPVFTIARWHG